MGTTPTTDDDSTAQPEALRNVRADDRLTIHTTNGDVEGTVDYVETTTNEQTKGVTVHLEPVGRSANDDADGFRASLVRPLPDRPWEVGTLLAEIYVEERLDYRFEERGEITGFTTDDEGE